MDIAGEGGEEEVEGGEGVVASIHRLLSAQHG